MKTIDFLNLSKQDKKTKFSLLLVFVFALVLISFFYPLTTFTILGILILVSIFFKKLEWGIYLMTIFFPFIYFQVIIGKEVNIPFADFIALFILIAFAITYITEVIQKKRKLSLDDFPVITYFIPFILICFISLINIKYTDLFLSIKYIFRPIIFFYAVYVVLPYNIIKTKKQVINILWILFALGIFVSIMGISRAISSYMAGLPLMAGPTDWFNLYPIGAGHNLTAEILVNVIPFSLLLFWRTRNDRYKRLINVGIVLMVMVNLLTLSRSGWIAMFVMALLFVFLKYKEKKYQIFRYGALVLIILLPLILYMGYFVVSSPISQSSNINRIDLSEKAYELFLDYPVIGAGAGTFTQYLQLDKWYLLDYGGVVDSHGMAQKLLSETGILGFLTFGLFLIAVFLFLYKRYKRDDLTVEQRNFIIVALIVFVVNVIFQLFDTGYYTARMWWPIGIGMAIAKLIDKNKI